MCTVTYLPVQNGFILTSSRDEKTTRPIARFSDPIMINDHEVTFPQDPVGLGTWIACSNTRTVCLLNGAFSAHRPKPPYKHSRGLVALHAFEFVTIEHFADDYRFDGLEPFTLIMIEEGQLVVLRWTGQELRKSKEDSSKSHIWSSATLYTPDIIETRENWFTTWFDASEHSLDSIRQFHMTAGAGHPENAIRMRRDNGYATVSITSVVRSGFTTEMIYDDLIQSAMSHTTVSQIYVSN